MEAVMVDHDFQSGQGIGGGGPRHDHNAESYRDAPVSLSADRGFRVLWRPS